MALLLGVSPWYALLACLADALAGRIVYAQPATSFSNTLGAAGIALCYGVGSIRCCAVLCKSISGCVAVEMWSATFW